MRLYTFCNYYLSSIQQGIQSAHLVHDLFVKYQEDGLESYNLFEWASKHKTMVVLNGGNSEDLLSMYTNLGLFAIKMNYPHALFCEDKASLNSAVTCVGAVLPEPIYVYNEELKKLPKDHKLEAQSTALAQYMGLSYEDVQLAELIRSYPLAK
ncbi:MAG: hypothetical protein E4H14_17545 [Candidatus Thorarchaeota archaeon]|nr:MAG: hypothetical protein E4H14_17545 [Candidatus Thorarchaeota archaeon]